jgi:hypothetical protein
LIDAETIQSQKKRIDEHPDDHSGQYLTPGKIAEHGWVISLPRF